ncbi:MAG: hypothetical protein RH917_12520 [Lacipirellulaceae bacterium]
MDLLQKPARTVSKDASPESASYISSPGQAATSAKAALLIESRGLTESALDEAIVTLLAAGTRGKRLIWLNTETNDSTTVDWWNVGQRLAAKGQASLFIATGLNAREAALAARDTGMFLGDVIVCTDEATACQVLADRISPSDAVLLHGVNPIAAKALLRNCEQRWQSAA